MKVIILGSTGILGKNLKFFLLKKKVKIFLIHRNNSKKKYFLNDFKNMNKLKKILTKIINLFLKLIYLFIKPKIKNNTYFYECGGIGVKNLI